MRARRLAPLPLLLALALAPGCDEEDEIGTPCESAADCSEPLICDFHGGKGTCQHEHDHLVVENPDQKLAPPPG